MKQPLLERLSGRCDAVEVYEASSDSAEVQFAGGRVKNAVARESSGLAVRALRGGRMGFAGSRDTSSDGLERLIEHVESSLEVGDPTGIELPAPSAAPCSAEDLAGDDPATATLGVPALVAAGSELLERLRARHPEVVFDLRVRRGVGGHTLRNSRGVEVGEHGTHFSVSVEANRTRDDDVLLDFTYAAAPSRAAVDLAAVADGLSRRLDWSEETVTIRPGRMPVLFSPEGSLVLWSPLLAALNGKTVMLGTSPLREKLGRQVLDPRVTVHDDGLLPGSLGSSLFDDEGLPRRRTALIEAGVLRSFVHDLETAQATGQAPTGNGERGGVLGRVGPGNTNLVVTPGSRSWEDLLAGIDYGLLVHSVIGMGQGNTLPGTFSNPVELAFLVEGGQVKGRVKDVSIAGNIYELLGTSQLGALGAEAETVYGSYRLPWLLIDGLNVVGKGA